MRRTIGLALAGVLAVGCSDDEGDLVGPGDGGEAASLTVDASQGWAFVDLREDGAQVVSVTDPASSADWDIAFNATSVMINGGAAGPGGFEGYCVCQNEGATDAQVMAMTASGELVDFEAVGAEGIPTDDWIEESLSTAIQGWYSYDFGTHTISPAPENVFAVRTASGDAFAKLHVIDIEGATQASPGTVTFEFALQPSAGAAFMPADTLVVAAGDSPRRIDLELGAVVSTEGWDVQLDGWDLRVNAGVSGTGSAGAYLTGETFESLTDASAAPARAFAADVFEGVFGAHPWYRYDLDGRHQIWPTYEVYLLRDGDDVWKVQLTGYYDATGSARHITFRYARL